MSKFGDKIFVRGPHTCPWWLCFTFDNPVRTMLQNPEKILSGMIQKGDAILDMGSGQGFFTLPLAKLTGNTGRVTALDIQKKMLDIISHKTKKSGLKNISIKLYDGNDFGLSEKFNFINVFWMFHEIKNKSDAVISIKKVSKKSTLVLFAEPKIHVTSKGFNKSIEIFVENGFKVVSTPKIFFSRAVIFEL